MGQRVDARAWKAGPDSGVAAYGDDTATLWKMRRRCLNGDKHAPDVDVQHAIEIFKTDGLNGAVEQDAGIHHDNVEATEHFDRLRDGGWTAAGSALSALIAKPLRPPVSMAATISAAFSRADTYVRATSAPSMARRPATAAPRPREPPNTIATLPCSFCSSLTSASILD